MPEQFLHGVEIVEIDSGARPIRTVKSSVIGLIGTAPKGPVNTPVLIAGNRLEAATTFGSDVDFTIPRAIDGIFDQAGAMVAVINVLDPTVHKTAVAAADLSINAGAIALAHAWVKSVVVKAEGGAGADLVEDTDYTLDWEKGTITVITGGALDGATAANVAYDYVDASLVEMGEVIGGTNATTGSYEGVWALLSCESEIAVTPRLLVAPGYTDTRFVDAVLSINVTAGGSGYDAATTTVSISGGDGTGAAATPVIEGGVITAIGVSANGAGYDAPVTVTITDTGTGAGATAEAVIGDLANPVVAEMLGIADRLRAIIIADGPGSTDAAAIAYRGDWGSDRVYVVDPHVLVYDDGSETYIAEPASARVAGLVSRSDNQRGFWWSPSNQEIYGIGGVTRPVDFSLGDVNARANYLNENEVTTIIREGGFRLWGNRTTSIDPKWAFVSVRRTADMIHESLLRAHLWAVDRNITKTYVEDVAEAVNAYLRHLTAVGAILGGRCWADPALNTPDQITQGKVYFDFDFTPPYPAEHITFRSHLVNDYIRDIFAAA